MKHLMSEQRIAIPLKRFLLIETCPEAWKDFDLYLFRDEDVVFYVGQSYLAFARVWEHLLTGFKGRSIVGRFVWCNWPASMRFTIELLSSQAEPFAEMGHNVDTAEQWMIRQWSPCFNVSHNQQAAPIPPTYLPANAPFRRRRTLKQLLREAERAVQAEENRMWGSERS